MKRSNELDSEVILVLPDYTYNTSILLLLKKSYKDHNRFLCSMYMYSYNQCCKIRSRLADPKTL